MLHSNACLKIAAIDYQNWERTKYSRQKTKQKTFKDHTAVWPLYHGTLRTRPALPVTYNRYNLRSHTVSTFSRLEQVSTTQLRTLGVAYNAKWYTRIFLARSLRRHIFQVKTPTGCGFSVPTETRSIPVALTLL